MKKYIVTLTEDERKMLDVGGARKEPNMAADGGGGSEPVSAWT